MSMKAKTISFTQTPLIFNQDKITMVYVLSGNFTAKRFHRIDSFQSEDLFFINPNEIYTFSAKQRSVILIIELDEIYQLNNYIENGEQLVLTSNILGSNQLKEMELVYRDCGFIQLLLNIGLGKVDNKTLEKIIYLLFENYNVFFQNTTKNKVNIDTIKRMYRILSKIHNEPNYKFSLQKISEEENMQKSYFAQVWKLLNDCSFLETVTNVRLQEAEKSLFSVNEIMKKYVRYVGSLVKNIFIAIFRKSFI